MNGVSWMVLRDSFPFAQPTELGVITAPDKSAAITLGELTFGGKVLVRSLLSLEAERYEAVASRNALNGVEQLTLAVPIGSPEVRRARFGRALQHMNLSMGKWATEHDLDKGDVSKALRGAKSLPGLIAKIDSFIAKVERARSNAVPRSQRYAAPIHSRGARGAVVSDRAQQLQASFERGER